MLQASGKRNTVSGWIFCTPYAANLVCITDTLGRVVNARRAQKAAAGVLLWLISVLW
jgi:hypothetical protein